jgi:hypothetical protein
MVAIQIHSTLVSSVSVDRLLTQARFSFVSAEHTFTQVQMLVAVRMTLSSHSQLDLSSSVALAVVA